MSTYDYIQAIRNTSNAVLIRMSETQDQLSPQLRGRDPHFHFRSATVGKELRRRGLV